MPSTQGLPHDPPKRIQKYVTNPSGGLHSQSSQQSFTYAHILIIDDRSGNGQASVGLGRRGCIGGGLGEQQRVHSGHLDQVGL